MALLRLFAVALALLALAALAAGHAAEGHQDGHGPAEEEGAPAPVLPLPDPAAYALPAYGLILLLALFSWFFRDLMGEAAKRAVFVVVAVVVLGLTLYMAAYTVYVNTTSATGGPVHWHADFEIWVCGEKVTRLASSEGLENKVGTSVFHHHNDYRIHVEGVVRRLEDVSLRRFFEVIGGAMTRDTLVVPLEGGRTLAKRNGDDCNGVPSTLQLYVNGRPEPALGDYVLAPAFHTRLEGGEGDILRIVFGPEGARPWEEA